LRERGVPVAVVGGPLVVVHQHIVSLAKFLEPFLRVRIVGVLVGMVLDGQLAVGFLDLLHRGRARDLEHFVIIAFCLWHV